MRSNDKYTNTQQANSKARHYPSKLIKQLMNSDSQSEHDDTPLFHDKSKPMKQKAIVQTEKIKINSIAKSINYTGDYDKNLELPPPLTTISSINRQQLYEKEKENINIQSNHAKLQTSGNNRIQPTKEIMYSCFRVQGNKIVDTGMYNSINLEDTSAIKDSNELYLVEIDKLKDDKKECMKRIIQLQQSNRSLQQRLNLVKQELQTKDMYYEELDRKMGKKQQQVEVLTIKILNLQSQINANNKKKVQEAGETQNHSRVPQLSRFLVEGINKSKYQTGAHKKLHSNQDQSLDGNIDKIYAELTQYIVAKVEQFKYKLLGNRMSKTVEDIIQEFMAQIVNINPITVSRSSKKRSCTPVKSYRNINQESWLKNRSNAFEKEEKREVTPIKENQRSDLRNLEKSLQKLRQMQKSYLSTSNIRNSSMVSNAQNMNANSHASNNSNSNSNTYLNGIKESYNSLDRSSIADVSRSKSRRKRIFQ